LEIDNRAVSAAISIVLPSFIGCTSAARRSSKSGDLWTVNRSSWMARAAPSRTAAGADSFCKASSILTASTDAPDSMSGVRLT
jgi:hypothetical protein